jgi:bifunctional oligoribonuclease and PAP phosphatase NrnA
MNTFEPSSEIKKYAPIILEAVNKATSILLHCHPSPDPDSVGSALAMKFALEQMGKKVTVIKGDSLIPNAFMHFPGAQSIVLKDFFEVDLKEFDLFIIQDSGSAEMVSGKDKVIFPDTLKTIIIDHHPTNTRFGSVNLVDEASPATAQVLHDLFREWGIKLTVEIASNLFMGTYTDTGGFKYEMTTAHTFASASELVSVAPNYHSLISKMENSNSPEFIAFQGMALSSVETFLDNKLSVSSVSYESLKEKKIEKNTSSAGMISSILRHVGQWSIVVAAIESEPNKVKLSFRTNDSNLYDVSKIAAAFGGGGHKAAGGATLEMSLDDAKSTIVAKVKELYNL